jgi:hypothetical protein
MLYPLGLPPDLPVSPTVPPLAMLPPGLGQLRPPPAIPHSTPSLAAAPLKLAFSGSATLAQTASPALEPRATVLRLGSQGEAVRQVQTRLQQLAYDPGAIDGVFGPLTAQAVQAFQRDESLPVDGVVGAKTWAKLRAAGAIAPSPTPHLTPSPDLQPYGPVFSAAVPQVSFHPIAVQPHASTAQILWITVLTLGGLGAATWGFQPDRRALFPPAAARPGQAAQPVHYPQPVYPTPRSPHQPQPVYPPRVELGCDRADPVGESQLDRTEPIASSALGSTSAMPPVEYLPSFVYDLLQPYSRYQLETLVQGESAIPAATASQEPPLLAALLQRVGAFPQHNYRTGTAYTYILLDDVGGCFRLCGNELWVTHIARHWLQEDVPYTAIIRRIDSTGKVLDKEFTVALSRQQLEMAA